MVLGGVKLGNTLVIYDQANESGTEENRTAVKHMRSAPHHCATNMLTDVHVEVLLFLYMGLGN